MKDSKQKQRTKKDIATALIALLDTQSFDSITVNDICDRGLIHRSTFYRHFQDKYSLLAYAIQLIYKEISTHTLNKGLNDRAFIEELVNYVDKHRKLFINVTINNRKGDIYDELVKLISEVILTNAENMDDPISVSINGSSNPKLLSSFYSGGIIEVLKQWINNPQQISKQELISLLDELIG
ncbi:TetR/AcrR family transcriptional regulator C-terminal domain-containing protein [Heyndrickxia ginsengihumi]|uniref:TetR/AcrR family transcriptional regulator C-terminal domain-containing protein n=1 Tax=Heyndrickxia ginsengihumi TaxID=363870 RepID=UPI0020400F00|nr:TetR/AcrR family transcriptional regulator C-terminal domain-containing protein [Heyndrickxia ginsengihumi]MCM3022579.1 TetR/AcrR family transcriptional regulator C-terminal domain-containing protein [Heyndrickxia ginsengihumi]